jgi:hypothetical protein
VLHIKNSHLKLTQQLASGAILKTLQKILVSLTPVDLLINKVK